MVLVLIHVMSPLALRGSHVLSVQRARWTKSGAKLKLGHGGSLTSSFIILHWRRCPDDPWRAEWLPHHFLIQSHGRGFKAHPDPNIPISTFDLIVKIQILSRPSFSFHKVFKLMRGAFSLWNSLTWSSVFQVCVTKPLSFVGYLMYNTRNV